MFLPSNITLKFGDSGDFVTELQRRLSAIHHFSADGINGFFDGPTVNAVSSFQSSVGIRADGIAGPETLRRLNGVISGDNSSTADHRAEDEAKARAHQEMLSRQLQQQQLYEQEQLRHAEQQQAEAIQRQRTAEAEASTAQPQPQRTLPEVNYAQPAAYTSQQTPGLIMPTASADDLLNRALLGTPSPNTAPAIETVSRPGPQPLAATVPPPTNSIPSALPPEVLAQQMAQLATLTAQQSTPNEQRAAVAQTNARTAESTADMAAAAPPPRGMVSRAVEYASAMMQKLANYFESKLPNHVIDEVKEIGATMMKNGVKEVVIATADQPQRGVEGPARGQSQAQIPQRS